MSIPNDYTGYGHYDAEIGGFIAYYKDGRELDHLCLHPAFRGEGWQGRAGGARSSYYPIDRLPPGVPPCPQAAPATNVTIGGTASVKTLADVEPGYYEVALADKVYIVRRPSFTDACAILAVDGVAQDPSVTGPFLKVGRHCGAKVLRRVRPTGMQFEEVPSA